MLSSPIQVVRALLTYTDWWQPSSASIIQVGTARRKSTLSEGISPGLLETIDERAELRRRMELVPLRDRKLLFLWYIKQLSAAEIAREMKISRRQCFRRKAGAIRKIVELGEATESRVA